MASIQISELLEFTQIDWSRRCLEKWFQVKIQVAATIISMIDRMHFIIEVVINWDTGRFEVDPLFDAIDGLQSLSSLLDFCMCRYV